ncbi:MAG: hypothetical protein ACUVX8_05910 [Candidatus Zipacnadales bacterium]
MPHKPANPFERHAVAVIHGEYGPQPQWKIDMLFDALARQTAPQSCRISYYHPREAGNAWHRWTVTRSGTRVRPGVASCTVNSWERWAGAWLWIEGYGVCHVEDCFPEGRDPYWFDLAVPASSATPTYASWLASRERARRARKFGLQRTCFVVLKTG